MDPVTLITYVIGGIVLVIALLVARGMYVMGTGSDAEFAARQKAADSQVIGSGFFLLDWARTADLPYLGEGKTRQRYRCSSCRHTWTDDRRSGWPPCPNCGDEQPEVVN